MVEGIARAGGGYADIITSSGHAGWEDRVVAILKAALTGHIDSLQVELNWKDDHVADGFPAVEYEQSPINTFEMSPFVRNRLYMLFDCEDAIQDLEAITLKALGSNGVQVTSRIDLIKLNQPDTTIHELAAGALLRDLERGNSRFHIQKPSEDSSNLEQQVRNEAVKLGCKWSLVSMWTSLVAVEAVYDADDKIKKHNLGIATINEMPWDQLFQSHGPVEGTLFRRALASPSGASAFSAAPDSIGLRSQAHMQYDDPATPHSYEWGDESLSFPAYHADHNAPPSPITISRRKRCATFDCPPSRFRRGR